MPQRADEVVTPVPPFPVPPSFHRPPPAPLPPLSTHPIAALLPHRDTQLNVAYAMLCVAVLTFASTAHHKARPGCHTTLHCHATQCDRFTVQFAATQCRRISGQCTSVPYNASTLPGIALLCPRTTWLDLTRLSPNQSELRAAVARRDVALPGYSPALPISAFPCEAPAIRIMTMLCRAPATPFIPQQD